MTSFRPLLVIFLVRFPENTIILIFNAAFSAYDEIELPKQHNSYSHTDKDGQNPK